MLKLSVVTITCRENPRLTDMAKTLLASLARAPSVDLEWIIVDEKSIEDRFGSNSPIDDLQPSADVDARFTVRHVPPLPSSYRKGPDKAPAHNSARMAGLFEASGEYIVFLADCTVVTQDWVQVAADCAKEGLAWRCRTHAMPDLAIPADGIVRFRDHHDLLRPVSATTAGGACWGVPTERLVAIGGFDLAYDGEGNNHDVDALIRLSRTGVTFVSTERAFTIRLLRTKTRSEVSTRKEVFRGARNKRLLLELQRDRGRTYPRQPAERLPERASPNSIAMRVVTAAAGSGDMAHGGPIMVSVSTPQGQQLVPQADLIGRTATNLPRVPSGQDSRTDATPVSPPVNASTSSPDDGVLAEGDANDDFGEI